MSDEREWHLERIRGIFGGEGLIERKMFGGNAFMLHGNMAVGLMGGGDLMVRVGPDAYEAALEEQFVREMDFTGRPMRGYVFVDPEGWAGDEPLRTWVERGKGFASTLPEK